MRTPPRMVLSATAGMGAACFCHPLDVVRVQMQIPSKDGSKAYTGTVDAVTQARAFDEVNGHLCVRSCSWWLMRALVFTAYFGTEGIKDRRVRGCI